VSQIQTNSYLWREIKKSVKKLLSKMMKKVFFMLMGLGIMLMSMSCEPGGEKDKQANDPYNGLKKSYREDGSLLSEIFYKDSIREGLARNYFRNGKVQTEVNYVKGVKEGEAKSYYEDGGLYLVTPYVNGKRQGIQKKYYPGNKLMAEIPFEDNEQTEGLKEYSKTTGKMITKETRMVFNLKDNTAFKNEVDLEIKLSDGSRNVKFMRYLPGEKGSKGTSYHLTTIEGKAVETFFILPGSSRMEKVHIIGTRRTRLGNDEIIKGTYNLAVENRKRSFN
jgi:antitoxin component YwqK of YwqJK toxin-antitoxin module